ncbi:hypothetical protein LL065_15320 [Clostridium estertheticum]|uniref:hypothetical protein n=1 Tax=Clostridium estertheticum TaxID=238834 RepID=UPI00227CBE4D|nr:hypothetical protein [Clostridium estertheticum]WAG39651.1 hypothetical protein LL065_15320 [Clostridium estertheticum]
MIYSKINKCIHINIKNLVKISRTKTRWRKILKETPKLKKSSYDQSTSILTRSALRDLLFNNI